jgi:hypothetical protein
VLCSSQTMLGVSEAIGKMASSYIAPSMPGRSFVGLRSLAHLLTLSQSATYEATARHRVPPVPPPRRKRRGTNRR